jgi:hypothetical protein
MSIPKENIVTTGTVNDKTTIIELYNFDNIGYFQKAKPWKASIKFTDEDYANDIVIHEVIAETNEDGTITANHQTRKYDIKISL